jgi:hypothetical protein
MANTDNSQEMLSKDELARAVRYVAVMAGALLGFLLGFAFLTPYSYSDRLAPGLLFFWMMVLMNSILILILIASHIFKIVKLRISLKLYVYSLAAVSTLTFFISRAVAWMP